MRKNDGSVCRGIFSGGRSFLQQAGASNETLAPACPVLAKELWLAADKNDSIFLPVPPFRRFTLAGMNATSPGSGSIILIVELRWGETVKVLADDPKQIKRYMVSATRPVCFLGFARQALHTAPAPPG